MTDFYYSWTPQIDSVDWQVETAEADEFVLRDGRRIYDFISTSFQANFGHTHATIKQRIIEQISRMPIASPKATFELKQRVSERLVDLIDRGPGKIFYTVSGAESVENALKIARQVRNAKTVLARQKSYHGATLGALSVTGDWRNDPHWTIDEGTLRIPDHDVDADAQQVATLIQDYGPSKIAAIILETISGTNGMSVPSIHWFSKIQEICNEHGILLILDEVLVGFGRCGASFAFHDYPIQPDMVCLSKAITGGYIPFGALWTCESIANHYNEKTLACGLTNYGHPLGLAALDAVMDTLVNDEFSKQKAMFEKLFANSVAELMAIPSVAAIRQRGLLAAIDLNRPAPSWQTAFDNGLHIFSKDNMCLLAPPYISSEEHFSNAMQTLSNLIR